MKRWLAFLCLIALLIAQSAIGPSLSVASDDLLLGDVNGDNDINMKDVLQTRKSIAGVGGTIDKTAADVNGDQSVDMKDVLLIRKYIAGLISAFPAAPVEPPLEDLSADVPFFRYGYDSLSDIEKTAYNDVVEAIEANIGEDTTSFDGMNGLTAYLSVEIMDENSVACVFRSIYADHPEFYFLCNHFSYLRLPGKPIKAILLHYCMTAAEREQAGQQLLATVNEWVTAIPNGKSDFDKEVALHDRLCNAVTYPEGDGPYPDIYYSPYSALVNGIAICDGYARALQLLLLAAEIKATVVEGFDANGDTHMWDVVYLGGEPYYVDPTWNDTLTVPVHVYCNVTTAGIAHTHTLNFWYPIPPTCTATKFNYYRSTGRYISSTDGSDYAALVAADRKKGAVFSEAQFAPTAMPKNRQLTESGKLCSMVNEKLPSNVTPLPGYAYSFFDATNTIVLLF